jgi:hypothetical protein
MLVSDYFLLFGKKGGVTNLNYRRLWSGENFVSRRFENFTCAAQFLTAHGSYTPESDTRDTVLIYVRRDKSNKVISSGNAGVALVSRMTMLLF